MNAVRFWLLPLALVGALNALCAGSQPPAQPIDINAATATELMELPRIGARTAARILAFRREHGPFQRPEDLMQVRGIGEKAFQRLRPYLRVGEGP